MLARYLVVPVFAILAAARVVSESPLDALTARCERVYCCCGESSCSSGPDCCANGSCCDAVYTC